MPQSSSFDDPFADLFDKLPDPRRRESAAGADDLATAPDPSRVTPDSPSEPTSPPPTSRRAAREAAARQSGTPQPSQAPSAVAEPPKQAPTNAPASRETLDDLFAGKGSTEDFGSTPPPPNKRRRRIGGWIAFGVVLVLLGGLAGTGYYVWTTYEEQIRDVMGWQEPADYEPGMATGEALVTISTVSPSRSF